MNDGDPGRRVIDGRFELQGRLGGGGMGTVWRARDIVLNRAVALKEVRPPDPGLAEYDPQAARMLRDRVLREAQALARVEHPGVVTIHHIVDAGADTYPWLVMELVTGGSLADQLALGPMEPVAAARLGRDLLAALRAAHDVGIQHRDVKPANVLLRPDGRPVLTDFGIAAIRESTALTATGSIIGTPDYMAPERISGDEGGPASDLWSLAMLLYVAVEGAHPLRRGSTLATLAAVLSEPLPPPRRAGVLTAALSAVLVKDPTARPDAAGLHALLAAAADGTPSGPVPGATSSTSYHLAPPATATAPSSVPPPTPGFGPATPWPSDGTPHPTAAPTPYPVGPTAHRTPGGGRGTACRRSLRTGRTSEGTPNGPGVVSAGSPSAPPSPRRCWPESSPGTSSPGSAAPRTRVLTPPPRPRPAPVPAHPASRNRRMLRRTRVATAGSRRRRTC
ncbi:protein kinase domain-containing protein [Streptomyces venezuelae ATCC 10712]